MPKCNCKTCQYSCKHQIDEHYPEATFCTKKHAFVEDDDVCIDWENDEMVDISRWVIFTIAVVAIVIFLAKIL